MAGKVLNINGCSPLQYCNGLIGLKPSIAYFSYANRWAQYLKQKRRIKIDFEQTYWEINYANTKIN